MLPGAPHAAACIRRAPFCSESRSVITSGWTRAHKLAIDGPSRPLLGYIFHDDRKPLSRWLESQRSYAALESRKLIAQPHRAKSTADRLRQWIWPAAPAAFFYTLLVKRCLLDGWPGWYYVLQRTYAELLLSLELLDHRLCGSDGHSTPTRVD